MTKDARPTPGFYPDPWKQNLERWWDGKKWTPQTRAVEQTSPPDDMTGDASSEASIEDALVQLSEAVAAVQALRVRAFVQLGLATLIGFVPAFMFGEAAAHGGVVWTGGALLAAVLLFAALRNTWRANKADRELSALLGDIRTGSSALFLVCVALALVLVGGLAWYRYDTGTAPLAVGDCVTSESAGLETVSCSSPDAAWRISSEVSSAAACQGISSEGQYIVAGDRYYCVVAR